MFFKNNIFDVNFEFYTFMYNFVFILFKKNYFLKLLVNIYKCTLMLIFFFYESKIKTVFCVDIFLK